MDQNQTSSRLSPKFFFLSLGVLITLIWSASSFLLLFFETLTQKFPDALNAVYQYGYFSGNFDSIRSGIASLIIVFPVFLVLSYFWNKASEGELSRVDTTIRKWMIYLVLFLASLLIVIDLVTLVRYFVSGEITIRFILKVLGVLVTATLIGFNYISELRFEKITPEHRKLYRGAHGAIALVLVFGLIVWSFIVIGSPKTQRALRFDDRRVQDLQSIQWQVISYWQQKEKLPEALTELNNPISGTVIPIDPEMDKGLTYEYKKTGTLSFELCATFNLPMPKGWIETSGGGIAYPARDVAVSYPYPGGANDSWDHQAGRTCFSRTIDKDLYPPYPKAVKE